MLCPNLTLNDKNKFWYMARSWYEKKSRRQARRQEQQDNENSFPFNLVSKFNTENDFFTITLLSLRCVICINK